MSAFLNKNVTFYWLLSTLLTLGLVACNPKERPIDPKKDAEKATVLTEKSASCEQNLRAQMESKALTFKPVAGIEQEIQIANTELAKTTQTRYSLIKQDQQNISIRTEHILATDTFRHEIKYDLALNPAAFGTLMNLSISFTKVESNENTKLIQNYQIGLNCEFALGTSSVETLKKEENDYSFSATTYLADGSTNKKDDRFTVPRGAELIDLSIKDNYTLDSMDETTYSYSPYPGVLEMKIAGPSSRNIHAFNMDVTLAGKMIDYIFAEKKLTSVFFGEQKDLAIRMIETEGKQNWSIPKALWAQEALSSSPIVNKPQGLEGSH